MNITDELPDVYQYPEWDDYEILGLYQQWNPDGTFFVLPTFEEFQESVTRYKETPMLNNALGNSICEDREKILELMEHPEELVNGDHDFTSTCDGDLRNEILQWLEDQLPKATFMTYGPGEHEWV